MGTDDILGLKAFKGGKASYTSYRKSQNRGREADLATPVCWPTGLHIVFVTG